MILCLIKPWRGVCMFTSLISTCPATKTHNHRLGWKPPKVRSFRDRMITQNFYKKWPCLPPSPHHWFCVGLKFGFWFRCLSFVETVLLWFRCPSSVEKWFCALFSDDFAETFVNFCFLKVCLPADSKWPILGRLSDPFKGCWWPPTRGSKDHFKSPGGFFWGTAVCWISSLDRCSS